MGDAQSLGWGPGWPHCQADKMATLVRPDGFRQPMRREIIPLVAWLMDETERRGYNIRGDWSWGYNCRPIRGYPNTPSNHSWGLALDINAPTNPMLNGRPGWAAVHAAGRTDMPEWMPPLWKAHGFGWGGDYRNRQDAMHYEVLVTPADVARITAGLHDPVGPLRLTKTLHVGAHSTMVGVVQELLAKYATRYHKPECNPGSADSKYGPRTATAVLAFKDAVWTLQTAYGQHLTFRRPLSDDVGPTTLGALRFWTSTK